MERYVLLLRGVNVGGKNKISMKELAEAFSEAGYKNARTYLNSGNLMISADESDTALLTARCRLLILERFGIDVAVMAISSDDLQSAMDHAPEWWDNAEGSTHNAIFVIPPATVKQVFDEVGETKPAFEKVSHFGNVIFWSAPIKTFSRTRWSKVVGSAAYGSITIRNANTAKKLAELSAKD